MIYSMTAFARLEVKKKIGVMRYGKFVPLINVI